MALCSDSSSGRRRFSPSSLSPSSQVQVTSAIRFAYAASRGTVATGLGPMYRNHPLCYTPSLEENEHFESTVTPSNMAAFHVSPGEVSNGIMLSTPPRGDVPTEMLRPSNDNFIEARKHDQSYATPGGLYHPLPALPQTPLPENLDGLDLHAYIKRAGSPQLGRPDRFGADQIFQNYGYLQVEGKWIDPDSEKLVLLAKQGESVPSPIVPGVHCPMHILTADEQIFEYDEFMRAVDNPADDDAMRDWEGDPRLGRISPNTFLKWSEGVVRGNRYVVDEPIEHVKTPITPRNRERERPKPETFTPQFDDNDGGRMSPSYSLDESPIPLLSPLVPKIEFMPGSFGRSYPYDDLALNRAASRPNSENLDWRREMPAPLYEEIFSDAGMHQALARPGDVTGAATVQRVREEIQQLKTETMEYNLRSRHLWGKTIALKQQMDELEHEVHLLRQEKKAVVYRRRHSEQNREYIEALRHQRDKARRIVAAFEEDELALRGQYGTLMMERMALVDEIRGMGQYETGQRQLIEPLQRVADDRFEDVGDNGQ